VTYVRQLMRTNRTDQAAFDALKNRHGVQWLVELTAAANYFALLSGVVNAFEVAAPADGLGDEERRTVFWKGFQRLSARDREILALRHFQELSYSAIARRLAIPDGTVMSRLFHARRRLREALGGYFEEGAPVRDDTSEEKTR